MYLKIARVFPRRTKATPDDPLAFTGPPPKGGLPDMEEVHVSVAFTYDMEKACQLAEQWMKLGVPVHMGGPAFNMPGGDFVPGMYLKKGMLSLQGAAQTAAGSVPSPGGKAEGLGNCQSPKGILCWMITFWPAPGSILKRYLKCWAVRKSIQSLRVGWRPAFFGPGM